MLRQRFPNKKNNSNENGITGQFFDPLKMADVIIMNGIKNVIEIK
jgi:hypothetical protein